MKLYKLTDSNGITRPGEVNELQWGEGVTHEAKGKGENLCSDAFIHAYENPLLAIFLNPIHASYQNPRMFECEGEVVARDGQLKVGCKKLTTVREIEVPKVTTEQRVKFAIYCAAASLGIDL